MREIVFRGKRTDNGEWVAGDFCRPCSICFEASGEDGETEWYDCAVAPETVGQYIGLTDRNGTPIFEGDVVRHRRELWGRDASLIGAVCRDDALCRFCLLGEHGRVPLSANAAARYEVIGNVHEVKPAACAEQLAALNDRLMDRAKYEALGEDVDAVVASLQHWLIEYDNCHPKRTDYTAKGGAAMMVLAIHFYRDKAGLTRAELAERVGVSEAEIKAYEGGFESPTLETAIAIADALGVTVYDLARGAREQ